jgi:hypothetical protein
MALRLKLAEISAGLREQRTQACRESLLHGGLPARRWKRDSSLLSRCSKSRTALGLRTLSAVRHSSLLNEAETECLRQLVIIA